MSQGKLKAICRNSSIHCQILPSITPVECHWIQWDCICVAKIQHELKNKVVFIIQVPFELQNKDKRGGSKSKVRRYFESSKTFCLILHNFSFRIQAVKKEEEVVLPKFKYFMHIRERGKPNLHLPHPRWVPQLLRNGYKEDVWPPSPPPAFFLLLQDKKNRNVSVMSKWSHSFQHYQNILIVQFHPSY